MDNKVLFFEVESLNKIYSAVLKPFKIIFSKLLQHEDYVNFSGLSKCLVLTSQLLSLVESCSNELQEINFNSLSKSHISFLLKSIKILKSSSWFLLKSSDLKSNNISFHQNFVFIFESAIGILREIFEYYSKDFNRFIAEKQLLFEELQHQVFFHSKICEEFLLPEETGKLNLEDKKDNHRNTHSNFDSATNVNNDSSIILGKNDQDQNNFGSSVQETNLKHHYETPFNKTNISFKASFGCHEKAQKKSDLLTETNVKFQCPRASISEVLTAEASSQQRNENNYFDLLLSENIFKHDYKEKQITPSHSLVEAEVCSKETQTSFNTDHQCSESISLILSFINAKFESLKSSEPRVPLNENSLISGKEVGVIGVNPSMKKGTSLDSSLTEDKLLQTLDSAKFASLSEDLILDTNEETAKFQNNVIENENIPLNEAASEAPLSVNLLQESFRSMFAALNENQKQIVKMLLEKLSYQINYFSLVERGKKNFFYCKLCKDLLKLETVQNHAGENKHLMQLAKQSLKCKKTSVVKNISEENMEFLDFIPSSQKYICSLCNVNLKNCNDSWMAHFRSESHISKLSDKETNVKPGLKSQKALEISKNKEKSFDPNQGTNVESSFTLQEGSKIPDNNKKSSEAGQESNVESNLKFKTNLETLQRKEKSLESNKNSSVKSNDGNVVLSNQETNPGFSYLKISTLCNFTYLCLPEKDKRCLQTNMKYTIFSKKWPYKVYCCACMTFLSVSLTYSNGVFNIDNFKNFLIHFAGNRHKKNQKEVGPLSDLMENLKFIKFFKDTTVLCSLCNLRVHNCPPGDFETLLNHFEKSEKHQLKVFSNLKNHATALSDYFIMRD